MLFRSGRFTASEVKEQVYLPDWRDRERVAFTANSAAVLAAILPDGVDGSISTVPGAFKPNGRSSEAIAAMAGNLMMAVADLVDVERRTGKRIALALEPEPCCFLETTDESIAFFKDTLLKPETLDKLGAVTGVPERRRRFCCAAISAFVTMYAMARSSMKISSQRWIACLLPESRFQKSSCQQRCGSRQ